MIVNIFGGEKCGIFNIYADRQARNKPGRKSRAEERDAQEQEFFIHWYSGGSGKGNERYIELWLPVETEN